MVKRKIEADEVVVRVLQRLWLGSEGRHAEAGETVTLPATTVAVLMRVGVVEVVEAALAVQTGDDGVADGQAAG